MINLAEIYLQAAAQGEQSRARKLDQERLAREDKLRAEDRQFESDQRDKAVAGQYEAENQKQYEGQYRRGFTGPLEQSDPGAAGRIGKEQAAEQAKIDAATRAKRTAALKINYDRMTQARPELAGPMQQQIAHLVQSGQIDPFEMSKPRESSSLAQQVSEATGFAIGTQQHQKAMQAAMKKSAGGGININLGQGGQGAVGLTTPNQTAQQGEVMKSRLRLKQLGNMKSAIEAAGGYSALGSFAERGEAGFADFWSKAGGKVDEAKMKARAGAIAAVGGFTNPIVNELAGANVPINEWDRMKQSLPDPIRDNGPALQAKIDGWEKNLRIIDEFGVDYLTEGINTGKIALPGGGAPQQPTQDTPSAGKAPPQALAPPDPSYQQRLEQLAASGDPRAVAVLKAQQGTP